MPLPLLRPSSDIVFKMLFASPESRDSLAALLEAVLKPEKHIKIARVINPDIPKEEISDKGIILDILVELTDETLIDVEIQVSDTKNIWKRALYYWARIYASQLNSGGKYESLRPTVVIFLLNFQQFRDIPEQYHHIFLLQNKDKPALLHPHLRLDFVELAKLPSVSEDDPQALAHERLAVWRRFLLNPEADDLQELIMNDPILKKTKDQLERISSDPDARRLAQLREDARRNNESGLEMAKREGLEEGKELGREEGIKEAINKLFAAGLDQEKIAELLQLDKNKVSRLLKEK